MAVLTDYSGRDIVGMEGIRVVHALMPIPGTVVARACRQSRVTLTTVDLHASIYVGQWLAGVTVVGLRRVRMCCTLTMTCAVHARFAYFAVRTARAQVCVDY